MNYKIKVTPEESSIVQRILFEKGYTWKNNLPTSVQFTNEYLTIYENGKRIFWIPKNSYDSHSNIPLSFADFLRLFNNNSVYITQGWCAGKSVTGYYTKSFTEKIDKYKDINGNLYDIGSVESFFIKSNLNLSIKDNPEEPVLYDWGISKQNNLNLNFI